MQNITCPKCGEKFEMDAKGYAQIALQVKDVEFNKQLAAEKKSWDADKVNALAEQRAKAADHVRKQETEIAQLKEKLNNAATREELAVQKAITSLDKENNRLQSELKNKELENSLNEKSLKESHSKDLATRDEMIAYYKDLKAKQSTKMVGETLEQHCEIEFNRIRHAAFPFAYFEKDNNAKSGTKGDYIFRDFNHQGDEKVEILSIMFEMKNEEDTSVTKKKNEDFLEKLHKDRVEKKCEYAVLVSLLENEHDLFNGGIVDYSHRYPKMYVIRPQFFIPLITLLRNASNNALAYKTELAAIKREDIEIENFKSKLASFQDRIANRSRLATDRFQDAIKNIDESIKQLEKMKDNLLSSENHFKFCESIAEEITVRKLTSESPTLKQQFKELDKGKEEF